MYGSHIICDPHLFSCFLILHMFSFDHTSIYIYIYRERGGEDHARTPQNKKTKEHILSHKFFGTHTLNKSFMILLTSQIINDLFNVSYIIYDPHLFSCFLILQVFSFDPSSDQIQMKTHFFIANVRTAESASCVIFTLNNHVLFRVNNTIFSVIQSE